MRNSLLTPKNSTSKENGPRFIGVVELPRKLQIKRCV